MSNPPRSPAAPLRLTSEDGPSNYGTLERQRRQRGRQQPQTRSQRSQLLVATQVLIFIILVGLGVLVVIGAFWVVAAVLMLGHWPHL